MRAISPLVLAVVVASCASVKPMVDCNLAAEDCSRAVDAAAPLLPPGEATRVVDIGRGIGFHAEVHACYPDGRYFLVDVWPDTDHEAMLRADGWPDPPCR
jgi:hypothetical protein